MKGLMPEMMKPNILLITTDTQRCDTLSCMGSSFAISPHLDRLAREGVLFTNAHTSSPVCSPARCSLLTGVHVPIHGCIENGFERHHYLPVFPDLLKERGYTNIMVGKTHFGPIPSSFDSVHVVTEKGIDANDAYASYIRPLGYSRVTAYPNSLPEQHCLDAFIIDKTIEEIANVLHRNQGEQPFFAHCSLVSPHAPIDPPGEWAQRYDDVTLPPIHYTDGEIDQFPQQMKVLLGLMGISRTLHGQQSLDDPEALEHGVLPRDYNRGRELSLAEAIDRVRKLYYSLASYCDAQIGRLIEWIDQQGIREQTLIVFSSDHGQQYFDHGFNDKHNFYDASWRVPLIMSMPGTLPCGEQRDFAVWTDITASILAAAGTRCDTMQGLDLFTPLTQGLPSPRRCAVAGLYKSIALATKRWKIEYYMDEQTGRLYDRLQDPHEQTNLFDEPLFHNIRQQLLFIVLAWHADLMDLTRLYSTSTGGGPVARRAIDHLKSMNGIDSEMRLNRSIEQFEMSFG
jgi:arylsulfatase A-like enzyme